jgi:acetyl-CoA acetyltransferase
MSISAQTAIVGVGQTPLYARDASFHAGTPSSSGPRSHQRRGPHAGGHQSAQIYDGFTWIVLASLEALGFCKRGEGRDFVRDGRIELGGALPINTSGGLLSEGHCSGANLDSEAVRQLRREVESERQVSDCQRVLITGEGDFHEGSALILGQAS